MPGDGRVELVGFRRTTAGNRTLPPKRVKEEEVHINSRAFLLTSGIDIFAKLFQSMAARGNECRTNGELSGAPI